MQRVIQLLLSYLGNTGNIILYILPANMDLMRMDPYWNHKTTSYCQDKVIMCLTKIDIMDRGTDASEELKQKGWIGLVNRSQYDLLENISLTSWESTENKFFDNHPIYQTTVNVGIATLR
jgi:dynamin 1-like protein